MVWSTVFIMTSTMGRKTMQLQPFALLTTTLVHIEGHVYNTLNFTNLFDNTLSAR